ncbi:hypothetical protein ACH4U6_12375 [Streptomyces netropsis]|uniref:hypothetical protein n=1 Tax=Streptomyces netropsis TaxID=55404 RepID=UPI0037AD41F8
MTRDRPAVNAAGQTLPAAGCAEVRIIAACPETARQISEVLRLRFAATEPRSYGAGDGGTRLHLTVDTVHTPEVLGPFRPRLVTDHPHRDET